MGVIMTGRWQTKVDVKSIYIYMITLAIYLVFLLFWKNPFYSANLSYEASGLPIISNNSSNLYLQFVVTFFLLLITANMFSQTFEKNSAIYIKSLPLSFFELILFRLVKLVLCILTIYLPVVYICFKRTNLSILDFIDNFAEYANFPLIDINVPIAQSVIFVVFFIVLIMFVYSIIKKKSMLIIAFVTYLAFEITFLPRIFGGKLSFFYGTFGVSDFYNLFNSVTITQIYLTIIMLFYIRATLKRR